MTNPTVDRFQVLSHNELQYPHKCGTCGSFSGDNGKRFIDFGLVVEFYGSVYICTECFLGAVSSSPQLQVMPYAKFDEAKIKVLELRAVVATLITENRTLRDALDNLRNSIIGNSDTDIDSVYLESGQTTEARPDGCSEESKASDSASTGDDLDSSKGESRSIEQTDVRRSTNIRENDNPLIGLELGSLGI